MKQPDLPEEFLESNCISLNDIRSIGGYIPNIVFESLASSRSGPLVRDIIPSYKGKENVFEYMLMDNTKPSFEFTAPIAQPKTYATLVVTIDTKDKIFLVLEYKSTAVIAKRDYLNNNISNSMGWEEYVTKEALYQRLTEFANATSSVIWASSEPVPFEWNWIVVEEEDDDSGEVDDVEMVTMGSDFT